MLNQTKVEFIKDAGGSIVSKNIMNAKGKIKWVFREESVNKNDNGWRFFSDIDDEAYVNNPVNFQVCDFNSIAKIEPAILSIYLLPIGIDLELVIEDNKKYFVDTRTGKKIDLSVVE